VASIQFHPAAQAEYEEALAWYHARSPVAAARFEAEIERTLDFIRTSADFCPKYDATHRYAMLRRFPYRLIFSAEGTAIQILAVVHAGRRPDYWRGRA
jgi:plasmid stabilization system protein ParE